MTSQSIEFPEEKSVECGFDLQREREAAKQSLKRNFALNRILGKSKTILELRD
ncbi:MAG: hypothetical protein GY797_09130, partial [Deltaproteobacteria bacterium]|nr:hypothetical protein [Deltaproteobacteria bacterium]